MLDRPGQRLEVDLGHADHVCAPLLLHCDSGADRSLGRPGRNRLDVELYRRCPFRGRHLHHFQLGHLQRRLRGHRRSGHYRRNISVGLVPDRYRRHLSV